MVLEGREKFRTPNGNSVEFYFRDDASDRSVIESILTENEYRIPTHYEGMGLDIGAHVGAWAIAAVKDNPGLQVIAIEAVYENVLMMQRNVLLNDLSKRIKVLWRAATSTNRPVNISYGFEGSDFARYNRFIGGLDVPETKEGYKIQSVQGIRLTRVARMIHEPIRIMKIDCEGCEWKFMKSPAIANVAEIVGEYHWSDPVEFLKATHDVEIWRDEGGFGLFRAIRR